MTDTIRGDTLPNAEFMPLPAQNLDADRQLLADLYVVPTLVYSENPMRQHALRAKQYPQLEPAQATRLSQIMEHSQHASERLAGESLEEVRPDDPERVGLGDAARQQLVNSNLLLVMNVANSFRLFKLRLDPIDLVLEGNMALLKIVDRYDWRQGEFVTYAGQALRNMMRKHVKKFGGMMSIPHGRDIAYVSDQNDGATPGQYELAAGNAFGVGSLSDLTQDIPNSSDTEGNAIRLWEVGILRTLLDDLPEREQHIVKGTFGLGDRAEQPQRELGTQLGISQMHVSRLLRRTLENLASDPSIADHE